MGAAGGRAAHRAGRAPDDPRAAADRAADAADDDPSGREQVCREDDQSAADCEFDEDEEKEVDECQTRGRALPWSVATLHELDRYVAGEDVERERPPSSAVASASGLFHVEREREAAFLGEACVLPHLPVK